MEDVSSEYHKIFTKLTKLSFEIPVLASVAVTKTDFSFP
jgi:hypothetical protein